MTRLAAQGRITSQDWDRYDTRHVVYQPAKMSPESLTQGYWHSYQSFYRWDSIFRSAWTQEGWTERLRHLAYAGGWKKFEPLWDWVIRAKRVGNFLPLLETVLQGGQKGTGSSIEQPRLGELLIQSNDQAIHPSPDHG